LIGSSKVISQALAPLERHLRFQQVSDDETIHPQGLIGLSVLFAVCAAIIGCERSTQVQGELQCSIETWR
jgi:hypothetical protein